MSKRFLSMMTISCFLLFVLMARASTITQSHANFDQNHAQNLCAPDSISQADDASTAIALDYQQFERVRIELLERGFNPGFNSERDATSDRQLAQAIAQFQYEYRLPVTGTLDRSTLAGLTIPCSNPEEGGRIDGIPEL